MKGDVYRGVTYVISCSERKAATRARAIDLYTSVQFRQTTRAVSTAIRNTHGQARMLILSARHGLVETDTILDPYQQRMGRPGSVTVEKLAEQAVGLGLVPGCGPVYLLLYRPYVSALEPALRSVGVEPVDLYAGHRGTGDHDRVLMRIQRWGVGAA